MIKEIKAYKTSDGIIWEFEADAKRHQETLSFEAELKRMIPNMGDPLKNDQDIVFFLSDPANIKSILHLVNKYQSIKNV